MSINPIGPTAPADAGKLSAPNFEGAGETNLAEANAGGDNASGISATGQGTVDRALKPPIPTNGANPNNQPPANANGKPVLQGGTNNPAQNGNGVGNGNGNGFGNGNGQGHAYGHGSKPLATTAFGNTVLPSAQAGNNATVNTGTTGTAPAWFAATSLAQSSGSQSFSSIFASSFATLYLSQPDVLRASFSHAVRRSNGHGNHHPTHQQQPSQLLADAFNQLNRQNRLALTSSPANARGGSGPTALLNDVDRTAFTRMVAASMRDFNARAASGLGNQQDAQSLHPQSILSAFGLMHADQLGSDWLAHGTTQLIALAQGAGLQEADVILEALALALLMSSLAALGAPNGGRSELALAQTYAAMQLTSQMQDPDAFAQMFSRLGSTERLQLLTLLASLSPSAKLTGLDKMDPIALLFKAFAARSGDAQLNGAQRNMGGGADIGGTASTLGSLLSARASSRGDTPATERLRTELLQFVATQPASFYFAETPNQKTFHSGRLEAVLQLIVQQLLRELAAKAGGLSKLRCDFADSIELLSSLLDLLTRRDDEQNEHSRHHQADDEDENEIDKPYTEGATATSSGRSFDQINGRMQPRRSLSAEFSCQTLFRVVPDTEDHDKVSFRWENFNGNPIAHLPRELAQPSAVHTELNRLNEYAAASSVASVAVTNNDSYELLTELLSPNDAAYALGATAAGTAIMAKHWHCKMWAHDLTYRLNHDVVADHPDHLDHVEPFDFVGYAEKQSLPVRSGKQGAYVNTLDTVSALRTETAMRHDLLRMLENSQDRWVREQAASALVAGIKKIHKTGHPAVESKGETVRALRTPMLRDATIYFLSRYYFKLNAQGLPRSSFSGVPVEVVHGLQ